MSNLKDQIFIVNNCDLMPTSNQEGLFYPADVILDWLGDPMGTFQPVLIPISSPLSSESLQYKELTPECKKRIKCLADDLRQSGNDEMEVNGPPIVDLDR